MPRKRVMRKRRPMRKRRGLRRRKLGGPNRLIGFPQTRIVKLRYCDHFDLDPNGAASVEYVFRANSVFDPDRTSTGHQPLGFDQWFPFYRKYCVIGSKISVRAVSSNTNGVPTVYGVRLNALDSGDTTIFTNEVEQGKSSIRYIQNITNGNFPRPCTMKFSAKKWFGVKDIKDNVAELGSLCTTNPTSQAYYIVWAASQDQSTDVPALKCIAVIDYIVMFFEPKELGQS